MKNQLRIESKSIRKNLDCEICSKKIVQNILSWSKYETAKNIMIYHPLNNEINLLSLCNDPQKSFFLPKILNNEIHPAPYEKNNGLMCGKFNIQEPCAGCIENFDILDLIFIPALCADKQGHRIGYGKGYYDRFLKKIPQKTIKAVIIYDELLKDAIPCESFDEKADFVVTASGIINC